MLGEGKNDIAGHRTLIVRDVVIVQPPSERDGLRIGGHIDRDCFHRLSSFAERNVLEDVWGSCADLRLEERRAGHQGEKTAKEGGLGAGGFHRGDVFSVGVAMEWRFEKWVLSMGGNEEITCSGSQGGIQPHKESSPINNGMVRKSCKVSENFF